MGSSLVSISVCAYERYLQIVHGLRLTTRRLLALSCSGYALMALVSCLPLLTGTGFVPSPSQAWCSSYQYPPSETQHPHYLYYLVSISTMTYIWVLLMLIGYFYIKIYHYIKVLPSCSTPYGVCWALC